MRLAEQATCERGIENPQTGVASFNLRGPESGWFGHEDNKEITRATLQAKTEEIHAEGPVSVDTIFAKDMAGHDDVSMHHDQRHVPLNQIELN